MNRTLAIFLFLLLPSLASAQRFQLSTNTVDYACLGTLNAEFDYALSRHWSLGIGGRYNPFSFPRDGGNRMQLRQRSLGLNARWWPWHIYSGWWLSGKAQWQEYNMGGVISDKTEEGQRYGGGITAGYSYMVNRHLNLDFGLGVWGGRKRYTVYACPECGTRLESGTKTFILPNDVLIALSYVF